MIDTETTSGTSTVLSTSEKINLEISSYLDIPTLEMDADPLAWWKFENSRFPNLDLLARKYLSICGTSVPSERSLAYRVTYATTVIIVCFQKMSIKKFFWLEICNFIV